MLSRGGTWVGTISGNTGIPVSEKGAANGVAELDGGGKVPASQLPSYVDDVLEYANFASFPVTGETGKLYIAINTGNQYRWSGSVYVQLVSSPGTTDNVPEGATNLYFTNPRASAAAPVQSVNGLTGAVSLAKSNVGLGNVDNTSDVNKPVSTAQQAAIDLKLSISNNLSDLANAGTARTNLGLGTAATQNSTAFEVAGAVSAHVAALDPHTQYLLTSEGDAAYAPLSHVGSGGSAHANATTSVAGFMSAGDKTKLDGVATGATNIALSSTAPASVGTSNSVGVGTTAARADHVHAHGSQSDGTLHAAATTSVNGFMSSTDKTKLDGVATNANNYVHPNHTGDVTSSGDGAQTIANDAVTNAKLANMATASFKGRTTAGTGDPEDLTATQATALLNVFTSLLNGLVPQSGGGTTNFLRADGTWAAPSGGGGSGLTHSEVMSRISLRI